jgi:hypothetical protein
MMLIAPGLEPQPVSRCIDCVVPSLHHGNFSVAQLVQALRYKPEDR